MAKMKKKGHQITLFNGQVATLLEDQVAKVEDVLCDIEGQEVPVHVSHLD